MRSLKSGLFGCVVAGLLGTFAVVGCSASGDTGDVGFDPTTTADPTEGDDNGGSVLPPSNGDDEDDEPTGDAGKKDAGKDAGKKDAGKDAGPPPPDPGDSCATADKTVSRSCGMCGKQEAICEQVNGKLQWSEYGPCSGETGVCMPGSTQACGNCGTQTCSAYCGWGACGGQPAQSCSPGAVQYTTAGCPGGGYKSRSCNTACGWENYSATCDIPTTPNKMTIQTSVGAVRSQQWTLGSETTPKPPSTCTGTLTSTSVRFIAVEVSNTTSKVAEISAYHTKSATGKEADTVLWVYNGNALPMIDAERAACVGKVVDGCSITGSPCGAASSLTLAGMEKISIPAGGKILVYSAAYGSTTDVGDGTFVLNLRTDKLQ